MLAPYFDFPLLGHHCTVIGADRGQEQWLRKHWEFATDTVPARPLRITVRFTPGPPRFPVCAHARAQRTVLRGVSLFWQQHGERWWSAGDRQVGVELKLHPETVAICVWLTAGAPPAFPLETALHVAMCEALRTSGLAPLHAAVIARKGAATALAGRSGIGKSTSLLTALAQGWHPVAEDFSWLDPASGWVYGWDRGVRLTEHAVAQLRLDWPADGWQPDGPDKLLLGYERLTPVRLARVELTRVAILHRDPQRASRWERLDRHECVRALCECVGVPLCRENRNYFADHVPSLLDRLSIGRLVVGHTPLPL